MYQHIITVISTLLMTYLPVENPAIKMSISMVLSYIIVDTIVLCVTALNNNAMINN